MLNGHCLGTSEITFSVNFLLSVQINNYNMITFCFSWTAVATWRWVANDDNCGICRMAFDGCCPDCKLPGDDCPLGRQMKF